MNSLKPLQTALGYSFQDEELLRLALTHPSVAHEAPGNNLPHNQRLEFLGDAVLNLVLAGELYERFPGYGEGPLTQGRAQMVNRRSLAVLAVSLKLGEHMRMSSGEEAHGGRTRSSSLADAFEAVVGAVYIDGGFNEARNFVHRCFRDHFGELSELPNLENPKGELQELVQMESASPPEYVLTSSSGPDHNRQFVCAVRHGGRELGRGRGGSKKEAESRAAKAALRALKRMRELQSNADHPPAGLEREKVYEPDPEI